jgi:hypothetical protein
MDKFRALECFTMIKQWRSVVKDPYPPASFAEAKKIYRQHALKCHPDKGGDPGEFRKLNEAFESLQQANITSTLEFVLRAWAEYWQFCSPTFAPPKRMPTMEDALAALRSENAKTGPDHVNGKAFKVIRELDGPMLREYYFSLFRMELAGAKLSHKVQATIMQNICSVLDATLLLLQMLLEHPCLRCTSCGNSMDSEQIHENIKELFQDFVESGRWNDRNLTKKDILEHAHEILDDFVVDEYSTQWDKFKAVFEFKYEQRVYQIRQVPRFHVASDKRPSGDFFSQEELDRFSQERDELLDPTYIAPIVKAQKDAAAARNEAASVNRQLEASRQSLEKMTKKLEVEKKRVSQLEEEVKNCDSTCAVSVSNKRSHSAMIATPAVHVVSLVKALTDLFSFLENLESSDGLFNVCDAIRHAYMLASAEQGTELEYEQASKAAKNRLTVIRPALTAAGATSVLFGKTKAVSLSYPDLSDVLLQDKRLVWFRKLHIQIVGNALLPCQEVHLALASHLQAVSARVNARIIADVLGVTITKARTMVPSLKERSAGELMKAVQCLQLVKDRGNTKRQCKKMAKITDVVDLSKALCCYHTASAKANNQKK